MKILALELSSAIGSIAFRDGGQPAVVRQFPADRKHSGLFYENLEAIRAEFGLPEIIAVGLGPGSYAGIRIAIATALGLRAASQARLVGLPSICAIALPEYCVVGDARRNGYFFAHVRAGRCLEEPTLVSREELQTKLQESRHLPLMAAEALAGFENLTVTYPSAEVLLDLAEGAEASAKLEPIYLRQPYITISKAKTWTR